jgi:NhaP-type Na+/H+ or K+/H+ antiporter
VIDIYLTVIGGVAVAVGLASGRLRELPVTGALVALVIGGLLGREALGVLDVSDARRHDVLFVAAEISAALAIMAAALRAPVPKLRREARALGALLGLVLPAMAVTCALLAWSLLAVPFATAIVLGVCLAPTDPVLSAQVVTGAPAERDVPDRVRLLLTVESGSNDGLSFMFVAGGLVMTTGAGAAATAGSVVWQATVGLLLGGGAGFAVGRLLVIAERHHDVEHASFLVLTVVLALFVLGLVRLSGGQPLLAVFFAGVAYSSQISRSERSEEWQVQEAVNEYLVLPIFVVLGAIVPWSVWAEVGWRGVAFAGAVLLIRRLPAVLTVRRLLGTTRPETLFLGWFGPVGVAALVYLVHAVERDGLDERSFAIGILVVAVSTAVHGVTATPGRRALAAAA